MIKAPGKFEGERDYAPFFYELMLHGCCDFVGDDGEICVFSVDNEERERFPELGDRQKIAFYERDDGFWTEVEVP
jgi:hypothetical protein